MILICPSLPPHLSCACESPPFSARPLIRIPTHITRLIWPQDSQDLPPSRRQSPLSVPPHTICLHQILRHTSASPLILSNFSSAYLKFVSSILSGLIPTRMCCRLLERGVVILPMFASPAQRITSSPSILVQLVESHVHSDLYYIFTVSFGSVPPSLAAQIINLTRSSQTVLLPLTKHPATM